MKYSSRILSLSLLVSMAVFFAGCDKGDDNKASQKDQQIKKLVGTWAAVDGGVSYEGVAQTDYNDFEITITGDAGDDELGFTVTGRPVGKPGPWPGSGSLEFGSPVTSSLIISGDNIPVTYTLGGTETLTLEFNYTGDGHTGRVGEVEGDWVFELQKVD